MYTHRLAGHQLGELAQFPAERAACYATRPASCEAYHGMAWCGVAWRGLAWHIAQHSSARHSTAQNSTAHIVPSHGAVPCYAVPRPPCHSGVQRCGV